MRPPERRALPALEAPPLTPAQRSEEPNTQDHAENESKPPARKKGRPLGPKNRPKPAEPGDPQRVGSRTFPASLPPPPRDVPLDDGEDHETLVGVVTEAPEPGSIDEGCLLAGGRRDLDVRGSKWTSPEGLAKILQDFQKKYDARV